MSTFLTPDDVAEQLQVTREWVLSQARAGLLPGGKVGRRWRFDQEAIDNYKQAVVGNSWGLTSRSKARAS